MQTEEKELKVDLGCGVDKREGFTGVDLSTKSHAEVIHNLEQGPYPFEDNSVSEVYSDHNIEHLENLDLWANEVYRICKPGAKVTVKYPHYSRVWFSTQHKRAYGIKLLKDYKDMFEITSTRFNYEHYTFRSWYFPIVLVINFFANLSPSFCERVWCYWFGGFWDVKLEARVKK